MTTYTMSTEEAQAKLERLKALGITELGRGAHRPPDGSGASSACVMEADARVRCKGWSDHDEDVEALVGSYARALNDSLLDEELAVLLPYVGRLATATTAEIQAQRAYLLADRGLRIFGAQAIACLGELAEALGLAAGAKALAEFAEALQKLPEIVDEKSARSAIAAIDARAAIAALDELAAIGARSPLAAAAAARAAARAAIAALDALDALSALGALDDLGARSALRALRALGARSAIGALGALGAPASRRAMLDARRPVVCAGVQLLEDLLAVTDASAD